MPFFNNKPSKFLNPKSKIKNHNWVVPKIILTHHNPNPNSIKDHHVFLKMHQIDSPEEEEEEQEEDEYPTSTSTSTSTSRKDVFALLSDETLFKILSTLPPSNLNPSLVCKRWFRIHGKLLHSLKLHDWKFLESGRMVSRFPNLADVDLVNAGIAKPPSGFEQDFSLVFTNGSVSIPLDPVDFDLNKNQETRISAKELDRGLVVLAEGCPNLRKLSTVDVYRPIDDVGKSFSTMEGDDESLPVTGLLRVSADCVMLQEMELYYCSDFSLRSIANCRNLQVLKLVACLEGVYESVVSDVGLTILAHGCRRLVKLELSGCEGSYDGISAIGTECFMLEELNICNHRMDDGWLAALKFLGNLKTLRIQNCKRIDSNPGPVEYLGLCPTLERLQVQRCDLRHKAGLRALFAVCGAVRELLFQDCWGLDNKAFAMAVTCRRVKFLSLEGCSLLTTEGLESVVLTWKELQQLRVISCNNVRNDEVTPDLANLFAVLKELKWRPDTKSVLAASLVGTGMGCKGGKFFKRV